MSVDKYLKFMKNKQQAAQTTTKRGEGEERTDYIKFFNANRLVGSRDNVVVRVLPYKGEMFFIPYKRHSFRAGSRKNVICGYSLMPNGEAYASSCPFCDFINENRADLDSDAIYQLGAKDQYMALVYDPWTDEIFKYDFNDYALTDILTAIYNLHNENNSFDPDAEGFDLHFRKGTSGYAEIAKVTMPDLLSKDLFTSSHYNPNELPDLTEMVFPPINKFIEKYIQTTFQLGVNVFAPTFGATALAIATPDQKTSKIDDDFTDFLTGFPADDITTIEVEDELSEEDLEISDLEKALAARSKRKD